MKYRQSLRNQDLSSQSKTGGRKSFSITDDCRLLFFMYLFEKDMLVLSNVYSTEEEEFISIDTAASTFENEQEQSSAVHGQHSYDSVENISGNGKYIPILKSLSHSFLS